MAVHDNTTIDLFRDNSSVVSKREVNVDTKYLVKTEKKLQYILNKVKESPIVAQDFETTSMHPHPDGPLEYDKLKVAGFSVAFQDGASFYIPLMHSDFYFKMEQVLPILQAIFLDETKIVWLHNAKFEIMVCRTIGIDPTCKIRDTQVLLWLVGGKLPGTGGLKLKPAVHKYLGYKMETLDDVLPGDTRAHEVSAARMSKYGADDSLQCLRLAEYLIPKAEELGLIKLFERLECPFIPVLVHMLESGFYLDQDYIKELYNIFLKEMHPIEDEFFKEFGIKITSSQQHSKRFFDGLKYWPTREFERSASTGCYPADVNVRKRLKALIPADSKDEKDILGLKAIQLIDRYNVLSKLNSTYTLSLIDFANRYSDHRLRTNIHQTGTDTGRISSTKPNLLNIPSRSEDGKKIRKAFIAEPGWTLVIADYSQSDLRVMAHETGDPNLIKAYIDDVDIHQKTADICKVIRNDAKEINLGLIYDMKVKKVAQLLGCSFKEAEVVSQNWHKEFCYVKPFADRMKKRARDFGFVKTITGRIRFIHNINSDDKWKKAAAERQAVNTLGQGGTGDLIKIAMRNMYNHWKKSGDLYDYYTKEGNTKIILQIYDEIILEVKDEFAEQRAIELKYFMETAAKLKVPLKAEPHIVSCWLDAK